MPHEVRMPQLGMTQDSGVIVAWLKGQGDKVAEGDALFEVETDKTTMEVEAPASGFLAGLRAGKGDNVPVGNVIAVIVDSEAEAAELAAERPAGDGAPAEGNLSQPASESAAMPEQPAPAQPTAPEPAPVSARPTTPPIATGKVLASPKAKRVAAEQGIDLMALRAQGVREPIHVADLTRTTAGGHSSLSARVDGAAFNLLLQKAQRDADRTMLFAAFAAGAWRTVFEVADVAIVIRRLDGSTDVIANPDRGGAGDTRAAAFSLVDLCDTRLSGFNPASGGMTLTVARDGTGFALTFAFGEAALPVAHAVALLDNLAARIEDPIRQLL